MSPASLDVAGGRGRARDGFTLLEVLAAALIFSMVVTVLIGTSSAGVRMSGISATRLEASLIAEEELARLETILTSQGSLPEDKEETREQFAIRVYSEPAVDDFGGGLGLGPDGGGGTVAAILATQAPGIDQFFLRYEIRVEWIEGATPEAIRRTTYAFDWEQARAALPDLFQAGQGLLDGGSPDPDSDRDPDATPPTLRLPDRNE